jgi:hypothetical protein
MKEVIEMNNCIAVDSTFQTFVSPELPSPNKKPTLYGDFPMVELNILLIVTTDSNCRVSNLHQYPLYEYQNQLSDTCKIWQLLQNSIDSVSKYWVFKPVYHYIDSTYPKDLQIYLKKKNKMGKSHLPFNGTQTHMFVLSIPVRNIERSTPNFLYWIYAEPQLIGE